MYNIGICDDVPELCDILQKQIVTGNYVKQPCNFHIFHNAKELLDAKPELDILFLDIEMPEMSGMELLHQYETLFSDTKVVLLTSHSEFVFDGYKVNAYRFCSKPISNEDLQELFDTLERELILHKTINIRTQHNQISIRLKDIIYIETLNNCTYIVTKENRWTSTMRLKEILPLLPEQYFYQPHKSFIINMKQIKDILFKDYRIIMSDGSTINIAIHKRKAFTEFYTRYLLRS